MQTQDLAARTTQTHGMKSEMGPGCPQMGATHHPTTDDLPQMSPNIHLLTGPFPGTTHQTHQKVIPGDRTVLSRVE